MSVYTIIVPDNDILQRVCGTNDSNLKLIESFLGLDIFACGNELSIDSENVADEQRFRFVVDRILDEFGDSVSTNSDSDIVRSVLNSDVAFSSNIFSHSSRASIVIPGGMKRVYPRTNGQARLVNLMNSCDMVFALGPAGCGKTFLVVAQALALVLGHQKRRIVLTRPVVEAGESLGFLPGDLEEKINPFIRPLYDAMDSLLPKETVRKMMEANLIEIAPLAYMRGRTLDDSVVILDEAQNTTREQMKMFLTRMGDNSKVFITGDETQIDLPKRVSSGLLHASKILRGIPGIGFMDLSAEDVVRNSLVKQIIQAYEYDEI